MTWYKKIKYTCGDPTFAPCVTYEKELPEFSNIEDDCYTIEDTTDDIYGLIGDIKREIDLSELGESCLEYILDEDNKIVVKNVLLKYEEEICTLKEKVQTLETTAFCDLPISECNLSLGDLADACDNPPTTFKELLQVMIDKLNTPLIMATCKQTNIPELDLEEDICRGDRISTDCVVQAEAIVLLGLPANSTQTQINTAIVAKLIELEAAITDLENA